MRFVIVFRSVRIIYILCYQQGFSYINIKRYNTSFTNYLIEIVNSIIIIFGQMKNSQDIPSYHPGYRSTIELL